MTLVEAEGALLEQALDATFPVWHDGLTRDGYAKLNAAQMRTPWGAAHLRRVALVDGSGRLLSSAKRYRLRATIAGRAAIVCGIGAIFTPAGCRKRGYARELVERIVAHERDEGAEIAMLFSEIGAPFYQRLAFEPVVVDEVTVTVDRKGGAPAVLVRAGSERDLAALASMHVVRSATSRFSLVRDAEFIHYSLVKKRLRAGLAPRGTRQVEFHVVEEGASAVAYVILSISEHGWTLDEAGDRDPAGARLGAMLQVLLAREPSIAPPVIRAWWPRGFSVPPQCRLTGVTPARDLLMLRPLGDVRLPSGADGVFYWRGDVF